MFLRSILLFHTLPNIFMYLCFVVNPGSRFTQFVYILLLFSNYSILWDVNKTFCEIWKSFLVSMSSLVGSSRCYFFSPHVCSERVSTSCVACASRLLTETATSRESELREECLNCCVHEPFTSRGVREFWRFKYTWQNVQQCIMFMTLKKSKKNNNNSNKIGGEKEQVGVAEKPK